MRTTITTVVLFFVALNPALAQESTPPEEAKYISRIVYSISGGLEVSEAGNSQIPLSILERLEREPALNELQITGTEVLKSIAYEGTSKYQASFIFEGMPSFREWYEDESTQDLLDDLKELSNRASLEYALHIRR